MPRGVDARRGEIQKSRTDLTKRRAAAKAHEQSVGEAAGMRGRLYGFSAWLVVASWVALLRIARGYSRSRRCCAAQSSHVRLIKIRNPYAVVALFQIRVCWLLDV